MFVEKEVVKILKSGSEPLQIVSYPSINARTVELDYSQT